MQWLWPRPLLPGEGWEDYPHIMHGCGYQAFAPRGRLGRLLTHNAVVVATRPLLPGEGWEDYSWQPGLALW